MNLSEQSHLFIPCFGSACEQALRGCFPMRRFSSVPSKVSVRAKVPSVSRPEEWNEQEFLDGQTGQLGAVAGVFATYGLATNNALASSIAIFILVAANNKFPLSLGCGIGMVFGLLVPMP